MAKTKRAADAAPSSNKRTRKATAAAQAEPAAADADADQQQQEVQPVAASSRRGRQPAAASAAEPASSKQPRKGRGKPAATEAAAVAADADEAAAAAAAAPTSAGKRKPAAVAAAAKPKPPYYLVKSEPDEFSIDMLKQRADQTEGWEGVRNYVARNHLRGMRLGDRAFFYHSSCKVPGIVGIVEVVREAYPDLTAQDKSSKYYDPKATADDPRWSMVDFKLVRELRRQITLEELKTHKQGGLSSMALFTTARLSVQPVSQEEWDFVLALEDEQQQQEQQQQQSAAKKTSSKKK